MSFFNALNFTSSNEDGRTELMAFKLKPSDTVLCLTASGTRPLDLLLGNPKSIIALDLNAAQNQLLALKIAAFKALNDDEIYAFLGIAPCQNRLSLYQKLNPYLSETSRQFWQARQTIIAQGVWYCGLWERVLRIGATLLRILRGRRIDELFAAKDVSQQSQIWSRHFDDLAWRMAISILSKKWFWTHIVGEPGGAFLPDAKSCEARIRGAFNEAAQNFLFRDSDFAHLIFKGSHALTALPVHLQPQNLSVIRERIDAVTIVEGGLDSVHKLPYAPFDAFSLSDFGSYCDQKSYDACWRSIIASASENARFCERIFMNPLNPSDDQHLRLDHDLSSQLSQSDMAIIYHVRAGVIDQSKPLLDAAQRQG